jgi:hypothetical protein
MPRLLLPYISRCSIFRRFLIVHNVRELMFYLWLMVVISWAKSIILVIEGMAWTRSLELWFHLWWTLFIFSRKHIEIFAFH